MSLGLRLGPIPRRVALGVAVVGVVVGGATLWSGESDERRVAAACDTWLDHRESLRSVLSETDEALGRAEASGAGTVAGHFNDVDSAIDAIVRWEQVGPATQGALDGSLGASGLELGAERAFGAVDEGVIKLHGLIESGSPAQLTFWVTEVRARMQWVDDSCGAAWRAL